METPLVLEIHELIQQLERWCSLSFPSTHTTERLTPSSHDSNWYECRRLFRRLVRHLETLLGEEENDSALDSFLLKQDLLTLVASFQIPTTNDWRDLYLNAVALACQILPLEPLQDSLKEATELLIDRVATLLIAQEEASLLEDITGVLNTYLNLLQQPLQTRLDPFGTLQLIQLVLPGSTKSLQENSSLPLESSMNRGLQLRVFADFLLDRLAGFVFQDESPSLDHWLQKQLVACQPHKYQNPQALREDVDVMFHLIRNYTSDLMQFALDTLDNGGACLSFERLQDALHHVTLASHAVQVPGMDITVCPLWVAYAEFVAAALASDYIEEDEAPCNSTSIHRDCVATLVGVAKLALHQGIQHEDAMAITVLCTLQYPDLMAAFHSEDLKQAPQRVLQAVALSSLVLPNVGAAASDSQQLEAVLEVALQEDKPGRRDPWNTWLINTLETDRKKN